MHQETSSEVVVCSHDFYNKYVMEIIKGTKMKTKNEKNEQLMN